MSRSILPPLIPSHGRAFESEVSADIPAGESIPELLIEQDRFALFRSANTIVIGEYASEILGRHLLLFFIIGIVFAGSIASVADRDISLALICLLFASMEFMLGSQVLRQRTIRGVTWCGVSMFSLLFLWWGVWMLNQAVDLGLQMTLLVLIILVGGMFPWPLAAAVWVASFGLCGTLIGMLTPGVRPEMVIAALTAICVSAYLSVSNHLSYMSRVVGGCIGRLCDIPSYAISLVRLLGQQLAIVADTPRAVLVFHDGRVETVEREALVAVPTDPVFAQAVHEAVHKQGREEGVLSYAELGTQFLTPCMDWFGSIPNQLFFFRCSVVVDGQERRIITLLPAAWGTRVIGVQRCLRVLMGVSAVVRMTLSAQRSRFQSSDVLLTTERSMTQREEEMSQLVHLVNNVVQEVVVRCDDLRETASALPSGQAVSAHAAAIQNSIEELSLRVSDARVMQELMSITRYTRRESVPIASIIEELSGYAQRRAEAKHQHVTVHAAGLQEATVSVIGREFLETALRVIIRNALMRSDREGEIELRVNAAPEQISILVSDPGMPLDPEFTRHLGEPGVTVITPLRPETYLASVARFSLASGGSLTFPEPGRRFRNTISVELPRVVAPAVVTLSTGQWVLLVDDNAEVITFYARVAEALSLRYSTASSVAEALRLLDAQGEPRLVISDLQLGDDSGLTLVTTVRQRYGPAVPIIVVSGTVEEDLRRDLQQAGVERYLMKPVGRRRLFEEIQRLIATDGRKYMSGENVHE